MKQGTSEIPTPVIYIAAGMLLVGAAPLPYGYYMLLRILATGVFGWAAFVAYKQKHQSLPWVFGFLAILFNPIAKIHLTKELWAIVDIGAGILLLATKRYIQESKNEGT